MRGGADLSHHSRMREKGVDFRFCRFSGGANVVKIDESCYPAGIGLLCTSAVVPRLACLYAYNHLFAPSGKGATGGRPTYAFEIASLISRKGFTEVTSRLNSWRLEERPDCIWGKESCSQNFFAVETEELRFGKRSPREAQRGTPRGWIYGEAGLF